MWGINETAMLIFHSISIKKTLILMPNYLLKCNPDMSSERKVLDHIKHLLFLHLGEQIVLKHLIETKCMNVLGYCIILCYVCTLCHIQSKYV